MKYLCVSSKVESRIAVLEKAGKAGTALARKATRIIESLASEAVRHHMEAICSYTKYGEKRIKNCRKYDLGCGYRLITLQRGVKVFIPFLGTHDECQCWLESNSRMKAFTAGRGTALRISQNKSSSSPPSGGDIADIKADSDDEVLQHIADKDLRRVFCGLIEGAKNR
ncbi:MAG: hypothetical protein ABII68_06515 [Pseudomonadota bacterium]